MIHQTIPPEEPQTAPEQTAQTQPQTAARRSPAKKKGKFTSIGGQALIEGIMMRGPHKTVLACRLPDGGIHTEELPETRPQSKYKLLGLPIVRGVVNFVTSMVFGYKALMRSAELSGMLDEEEDKSAAESEKSADGIAADESAAEPEPKKAEQKGNGVLMGVIGTIATVLGVALAVVLFLYLPTALFNLCNALAGKRLSPWRALFEGVLKILIFVAYIVLVSRMKEIRRVFMYHGAEHKSIFCYEHGLPLTVENIRAQRRFHPRCGTSFLILMLLVSIVFYALLSIFVPVLTKYAAVWVGFKLLMLPVICGVGYELIKFCGRHDNLLTRIISAPGLWLQRITTKEPDDGMMEIAAAALTAVIPENEEDDRW